MQPPATYPEPPEPVRITNHCPACGAAVAPETLVCPSCAGSLQPTAYVPPKRVKARQVPGSIPAAVLVLIVGAFGALELALTPPGQARGPNPVFGSLILGLGLLLGGPGFRTWGLFTHSLGLVVMPLLWLAQAYGPSSGADWLGLPFNVGILLLLAGEPTRRRVWCGVGVCVLSLLLAFGVGVLEELRRDPVLPELVLQPEYRLPVWLLVLQG